MRRPISVEVMLFPIDQLSSCMSWCAPEPYASATIRPRWTTTNAARLSSALPNITSTASASSSPFTSAGSGSSGRRSPMGQGVVAAWGNALTTLRGVKKTLSV